MTPPPTPADAPPLPPAVAAAIPFARRLQRISLRGGGDVELHLLEHGRPGGRPVVFLHGNRSWSVTWRHVLRRSTDYRLLAVDLPALGLSGPLPAERRTIEGYGEAIARLIESLELADTEGARVVVVAHEAGGLVAAEAGRQVDLGGLVLVDSALLAAKAPVPPTLHRFGRWPRLRDVAFAATGRPRLALEALQSRRAEFADISSALYAWPLDPDRRRAMVDLAALAAEPGPRHSAADWLLDFPGPLALVWGHSDPLMPREELAAQERELPYARIWRTEAGHFVQEEEPGAVAEAIAWTVERVGQAADGGAVPANLLPGIGSGDFAEVGRDQVRRLIEVGGLAAGDRILDLGCGLGRTASALRDFLTADARYHGIDVVPDIVRWCQQNLTRVDRRLRFHHAPVRNSLYSPAEAIEASEYRFPFADASIDFVVAESLFTHLTAEDARHYLDEIGRVLRNGGTLCASVFLLDATSRRAISEQRSDHRFETARRDLWIEHPDQPLLAVAFDDDWFRRALASAGLELSAPPMEGAWRGTTNAVSYQDTLVARRR